MENTARDFWKMIVDYKVSAIVMLCGEEAYIYSKFILYVLITCRIAAIHIGLVQRHMMSLL